MERVSGGRARRPGSWWRGRAARAGPPGRAGGPGSAAPARRARRRGRGRRAAGPRARRSESRRRGRRGAAPGASSPRPRELSALPPRSSATTWARFGMRPSMLASSRTSITSTGWWRLEQLAVVRVGLQEGRLRLPDRDQVDLQGPLRPARQASAAPIRSSAVGWVPSRKLTASGGSGSERLVLASRCCSPISACGVVGQLQREGVGPGLDRARELVADHPDRERGDRQRHRQRRQRGRLPGLGAERRPSARREPRGERAARAAPRSPRTAGRAGCRGRRTWPSSWATTERRSPRSASSSRCRRGPPAWSARGRRRRRSVRCCDGWRRRCRPRRSRRPALSPSSSTSDRAWPGGSFSKSLKAGASTTGASQVKAAASATSAALPGIHQRSGEAADQRQQPAADAGGDRGADRRSPLPSPPSQAPRSWVERPTSTARSCAATSKGSETTESAPTSPRGGRGAAQHGPLAGALESAAGRRRPAGDQQHQQRALGGDACRRRAAAGRSGSPRPARPRPGSK